MEIFLAFIFSCSISTLFSASIPELIDTNSMEYTNEFKLPAEPVNPSEFEAAKTLDEKENGRVRGSSVYENEVMYTRSFQSENLRNGLVDERKRWPKVGENVYIPYIISSKFDQRQRQIIAKAFDNFHENTCLRFIPRIKQNDYVHIIQGEGCDSDAGRIGGEQTLSLGPGCDYTDTAIHELNHAVGFWHEQNRPDRDKYVVMYMENVKPENRFNFDKMSPRQVNFYGVEYDTNSIMHYDKFAFSKDPKRLPVMEPKVPNPNMGLAKTLSKSDILRIKKMYNCGASKSRKQSGTRIHDPDFMESSFEESDTADYDVPDFHLNSCGDFHHSCSYISRSSEGCDTNAWVRVSCRESCSTCANPCQDMKLECTDWATSGACETHSEYMKLYCPKSCQTC